MNRSIDYSRDDKSVVILRLVEESMDLLTTIN